MYFESTHCAIITPHSKEHRYTGRGRDNGDVQVEKKKKEENKCQMRKRGIASLENNHYVVK